MSGRPPLCESSQPDPVTEATRWLVSPPRPRPSAPAQLGPAGWAAGGRVPLPRAEEQEPEERVAGGTGPASLTWVPAAGPGPCPVSSRPPTPRALQAPGLSAAADTYQPSWGPVSNGLPATRRTGDWRPRPPETKGRETLSCLVRLPETSGLAALAGGSVVRVWAQQLGPKGCGAQFLVKGT